MSTEFKWISQTITRELTEFIINIATLENIEYSKISNMLNFCVSEKPKPKIRNRVPATENRCIARLIKDGTDAQCSHKALDNMRMCKRHNSCELKYGTIYDTLSTDILQTLKKKVTETNTINNYVYNYNFNINLFPKNINNFREISIMNGLYYIDIITNCVYTHIDQSYYYVGTYEYLQKKIRYSKII